MMPLTQIWKTSGTSGFGEDNWVLSFAYVQFEMPVRYPSIGIE